MRGDLELLLSRTGDIALRRRAFWLIEKLDPEKRKKILDVGCGDGFYLHLLLSLKNKNTLVGIDIDPNALSSAKKNLKGRKIKLLRGDLTKLPFKKNAFDAVLTSEVLEHVEDEVGALKEIRRVLKPKGVLVLSVPHANYPLFWDPVNYFLERMFRTHISTGFWAGIWNQHRRLYTRKKIESVLKKSAFKKIETDLLTHYSLPFNHHIINLVARILARKNSSSKIKKTISKFSYNGNIKNRINIFYPFFLFDKLNDLGIKKKTAVSLVAYAEK